jgi:hypothetical protein
MEQMHTAENRAKARACVLGLKSRLGSGAEVGRNAGSKLVFMKGEQKMLLLTIAGDYDLHGGSTCKQMGR